MSAFVRSRGPGAETRTGYIPLIDRRNAVAYAQRVKWFSRQPVIIDDLWNAAPQRKYCCSALGWTRRA